MLDRSNSHDVVGSADSDDSILYRPIVGSAGSPVGHSRNYHHKPRKALINPFAPSRMRFKMTSNRRRWVHAFPTGNVIYFLQLHICITKLQILVGGLNVCKITCTNKLKGILIWKNFCISKIEIYKNIDTM